MKTNTSENSGDQYKFSGDPTYTTRTKSNVNGPRIAKKKPSQSRSPEEIPPSTDGSSSAPVSKSGADTRTAGLRSAPISLPPPIQPHDVKVDSTSTSSHKKWVDIVSPPKQATVPPAQVAKSSKPVKTGEKRDKEEPATPPVTDVKKKGKKISISSSSSSDPPEEKPPARPKSKEDYGQWIKDFSKLGADMSHLKFMKVGDAKKETFYVVWEGRGRGIFLDWDSCKQLTDKQPGAKYKKVMGTLVDVLKFFKEKLDQS